MYISISTLSTGNASSTGNLPHTITTVNTNNSFEVNCGFSGYPTSEVQLSGVDTPLKSTKHQLTSDEYCRSVASATITWDNDISVEERKKVDGRSVTCKGSENLDETFSINVQCKENNCKIAVILIYLSIIKI